MSEQDVEERRKLYELLRYLWMSVFARAETTPPTDDAAILDRLRTAQADAQERMRVLARDLTAGTLSVDAWKRRMETEVRVIHALAAALGRGSFGALTARDLQALTVRVETQLRYLEQWVQALRPPTRLNEQQTIARATLYAGAASETYYAVRVSALGLPDLPLYPGSGDTQCMVNCKCHLDIRKLEGYGNWDVWWVVDITAEHCPDCIELGQVWAPLEIREGVYRAAGVFGRG